LLTLFNNDIGQWEFEKDGVVALNGELISFNGVVAKTGYFLR
jgi:N-acetylglucosamine kinase-like BadF-type ATPase